MALSRLLRCCSKTGILRLRCSYRYLFHETKWMPREFKCETASGEVRGIRRRKGAGFSSEIEMPCVFPAIGTHHRRKGAGFSSEIEMLANIASQLCAS